MSKQNLREIVREMESLTALTRPAMKARLRQDNARLLHDTQAAVRRPGPAGGNGNDSDNDNDVETLHLALRAVVLMGEVDKEAFALMAQMGVAGRIAAVLCDASLEPHTAVVLRALEVALLVLFWGSDMTPSSDRAALRAAPFLGRICDFITLEGKYPVDIQAAATNLLIILHYTSLVDLHDVDNAILRHIVDTLMIKCNRDEDMLSRTPLWIVLSDLADILTRNDINVMLGITSRLREYHPDSDELAKLCLLLSERQQQLQSSSSSSSSSHPELPQIQQQEADEVDITDVALLQQCLLYLDRQRKAVTKAVVRREGEGGKPSVVAEIISDISAIPIDPSMERLLAAVKQTKRKK